MSKSVIIKAQQHIDTLPAFCPNYSLSFIRIKAAEAFKEYKMWHAARVNMV